MTRTEQQDETASGKHGDDLMSINWTLNMRRKCCRFFSSSKINHDNNTNKLSRKSQVKNFVNSERKVINLDEDYNHETCSKLKEVSSKKKQDFVRRTVISDVDDLVSFMRGHDNKEEGEVFDDEEVKNRDAVLNDDKVGLQQAKLDLLKKRRNNIVEEGQIVAGKQVIACEEVAAADETICKSDNFSLSASSSILSQLLNSSLNQLIEIDDGSSVGTTFTATSTNITCRRNNISNNRISTTSCDTYPPSAVVPSQSERDYLLLKHFPNKTTTQTATTTTRRDRYSRQAKRNEKIAKRQQLSRGSISMLDVRYGVTGSNENGFKLGGGFNNERRITLDELPSGHCKDKGDFVDETSFHNLHHSLHNNNRRRGFKNSSHYCHQSNNANLNNSHETGVLDSLKAGDQQQFVTFDKKQHFKQQNQIQIQIKNEKANNELSLRDLIQQRENFTSKKEKQVNHQQIISPEQQTYKCLAQSKLSELELEKHCCYQEEEGKHFEQEQKLEMQTPNSQKCPPQARMLINGSENLIQNQHQNQNQNQASAQTQIIQYDSLLSQTNQQPEQKRPVAFDSTPFLAPQFLPDFQCCPFCLSGSNISLLEPETNINMVSFDNEHFAAGVTHNNNLENHLSRQTNQPSLSSTCSSTSFSSHNLQVTTDSASSGHDSPPQEQEQRNKVARVDCGSAMGLAPSSMLRNAQAHVVSPTEAGCERGLKKQFVAATCCEQCELFVENSNSNSQANDQHQKLNNINNNIIKQSQTEDLDQLLNNTYADIKQHFSTSEKSPISYLSDLNNNNNNTLVLPLTQIQTKEYCQKAVDSNTTSNDNSLPGRPIFSLDPRTLISASQHQQQHLQSQQQAVEHAHEEEEDSDQVSMLEATANLARVVDSSTVSSVISSSASSLNHHCSRLKSRNLSNPIPMPLPRFNTREEEPIYDIPSLSVDNLPATTTTTTENNSSLPATKSSKYNALIMCKPIEEREMARSQQVTFVRCLSPDQKYPAVRETPPAISSSAAAATTTTRHQETRSGTNLNLVIKTTKSANKVSERQQQQFKDNNEKFKTCKCRRCLHTLKVAPKEHVRKKFVGERMNSSKRINLEDSLSQLSRVAAYGSGDRLIDNYYKRRFNSTGYSSHIAALTSCCSTCCSQFDFSSASASASTSTSTMNTTTATSSTPSTIVYLRKKSFHRRGRNLISEQSCNETATTTTSCCSTCCSTVTFDKHSLDTEESSVETVGSLTQEYLRRHRSMARVGRNKGRILHRSSCSRTVYSHNRHTSAVRRGRRRTKRKRKRSYHYLLPATTMTTTTTNTRKKRVQSSRHRSGKYRVSSSVVALDDVDADADGGQTNARLSKLIDQKRVVGEYDDEDEVNNLVGEQQKGKRLLISKRHAKFKTTSSRPIYNRNEESLGDKVPLVSLKHNRKLRDRDGVDRQRDLSENSSLCSQLATNRHRLNQSRLQNTATATTTITSSTTTSTSTSNSTISSTDTATVAGNYTRLTDEPLVGGRQVNEQQQDVDLDSFRRRLKSSQNQKATPEQSSGNHNRNNNNKRHNYTRSQRATNATGDERKVPLSKQHALQRQRLPGTSGGRDRSAGQVRKQQVVGGGGDGDESDPKAHKLKTARRATSSHGNNTLCSCQRKLQRRQQQQQRKQQCEQNVKARPSRRYLRQLNMIKDKHKSTRNLDASLLSPNRLQLVTKKASSSKQKKLIRLIRQQQQELERARFKQLESARRQGLLCKALLSSRINSPSNESNKNNLLGAKDNYYYVGQQVEQGKENEDIKYKFSLDRMLRRMFSLRFKSSKAAAFPNDLTKTGRTKGSRVGSRSRSRSRARHHHRRNRKFNHCHRHRHHKYSDAGSSVTMNQLRLMQKALIASANCKKTKHRYLSNLKPNPEQEGDTHSNIMDRFLVKPPRQLQQLQLQQADTTASNLRWQLAPKQCQCNHCVMVDYLLEAKRNKRQQ